MPTASAYHLENLLNDYLGCGECKLLKSKIQVFLHQAFLKRQALIISRLCGSLCLNSHMPNTFILGDSHVRVRPLRKSVTPSYKVNKEFRFKVFCTVLILWGVCVCVCVCVCARVRARVHERVYIVFPLREVRGKTIHACVCWLFSPRSSPLHIMHICSKHEYTCFKRERERERGISQFKWCLAGSFG